jgi:GH24 family phage-related lysozyme (muramidase)
MTLNYAPLLTEQEYVDALVGFITGIEGLNGPGVYKDSVGVATIGYGYTFKRNNNVAMWQAAGISLTSTELALLQKIDAATTEAETLLLKTYPEYEAPAVALGMPFSFERAAFVSLTLPTTVG